MKSSSQYLGLMAKMVHCHYLAKKLTIYHCFENMKGFITFLALKFVKLEFAVKLEFQKLEFFEKIYFEKFSKFFHGTRVL